MARLSRRKLASHVADELLAGNAGVMNELAALLVDEGRTSEAELIVRDIESALARRGIVVAEVASAHELSAEARQAITAYVQATTGAAQIELYTTVDEALIGGFRLRLPGGTLDTTVKGALDKLTASKV